MKKFYTIRCLSAPKGDSGEILGMKYDLSETCKVCGTGAKLIGNLVTKGIEKVKQDFFLTSDTDYIISEALYNVFMENSIEPALQKVVNRDGDELPYYYLHSQFSFPPMLPKSKGIQIDKSQQCLVCKRDGHFDKLIFHKDKPTTIMPTHYTYSMEDKKSLENNDIFHTWEYFGGSVLQDKKPQFARATIIISEAVKDILEKYKVKKLKCEEVKIL